GIRARTVTGVQTCALPIWSGHITLREDSPAVPRGRGRPAKRYIATPSAHPQGEGAYADMAVQALQELSEKVGPEALAAFAEQRRSEERRGGRAWRAEQRRE